MPTVRRCRINRNRTYAIDIDGEAGEVYEFGGVRASGGVFEENDLRGNKEGAWHISPESLEKVTRQGNIED
jgi:hypothetical protein